MDAATNVANGGVVVVTTDTIDGCRISVILGAVVGVAPLPSSPYHYGLKSVDDGSSLSSTERSELMRRSREEAIELLAFQARKLGGNAVVAMRFDHRQVTDNWNEICAYGTAVRVTTSQPSVGPEPAPNYQGGAAPWGSSVS